MLSEELVFLLKSHGKNPQDVKYVIYAVGNALTDTAKYYCDFNEFLEACRGAIWGYDLQWPYELKIVGEGFWVSFNRGDWVYHQVPEQPEFYRQVCKDDLCMTYHHTNEDNTYDGDEL